jgi:hypothetical protein
MAKEQTVAPEPVNNETLLSMFTMLIENQRNNSLTPEMLDKILEKADKRRGPEPNPYPPGISAFSEPEGDNIKPKPQFLREMWVNGHRTDIAQVSPTEVLALNAVSESLPNSTAKKSARNGRLTAGVSNDNTKVMIMWPCKTEDDRSEFNGSSLIQLCYELVTGESTLTQQNIIEEVIRLRAEMAALRPVAVPA